MSEKKSWVHEEMGKLGMDESGEFKKRGKSRIEARRVVKQKPREIEPPAIDFGNKLMPLNKLAKHSGIGRQALSGLVKNGLLKKRLIPGARRPLYSTLQLAHIVQQYNRIA